MMHKASGNSSPLPLNTHVPCSASSSQSMQEGAGRSQLAVVICDDRVICYELDGETGKLRDQQITLRSPRTEPAVDREISAQFDYGILKRNGRISPGHSGGETPRSLHSREQTPISLPGPTALFARLCRSSCSQSYSPSESCFGESKEDDKPDIAFTPSPMVLDTRFTPSPIPTVGVCAHREDQEDLQDTWQPHEPITPPLPDESPR